MHKSRKTLFCLIFTLVAATVVYLVAHWSALTSPYVINDDVRQQIYWMQSWTDPELFRDDPLSRYARYYVPWGVQAVYAIGSQVMNPVQLTKVVTAVLFVVTAGFLFGLGRLFKDDLTGVLTVCVFFLFGTFLDRMAGGLSRGFVYPLMAGYAYFLGRDNITHAGIVLLLLSLFNPYAFLVCLATHVIFIAHGYANTLLARPAAQPSTPSGTREAGHPGCLHVSANTPCATRPETAGRLKTGLPVSLSTLAAAAPVVLGVALVALKYAVFTSTEFGDVVTLSDMSGRIEYTDSGRYGIIPVPSIWYDLVVSPWIPELVYSSWEVPIGVLIFVSTLAAAVWALRQDTRVVDLTGFRVFFYLLTASVLLYAAARVMLMKMFLPSRYLEFSIGVFYCVLIAVCMRIAIERFSLGRTAIALIAAGMVAGGAVRLHNVGLWDYSDGADLYRFMRSTPKTALIAGHPAVMDNITTFGTRKAFVTYEMSHTWYKRYWNDIRSKTFDFFRAYYSEDPDLVREFSRKYGIDYLVVREEDFEPQVTQGKSVYFEPFGSYIEDLVKGRSNFAVLDAKEFPPVFRDNRIRIFQVR
ncbi:MAG: hypothetical protein RDU20_12805 [Desulfomonilaceae bacterium]|nr:hypothetical protein [Desulfomonilaceae bacterium]